MEYQTRKYLQNTALIDKATHHKASKSRSKHGKVKKTQLDIDDEIDPKQKYEMMEDPKKLRVARELADNYSCFNTEPKKKKSCKLRNMYTALPAPTSASNISPMHKSMPAGKPEENKEAPFCRIRSRSLNVTPELKKSNNNKKNRRGSIYLAYRRAKKNLE
mmetsp:Transcript_5211/g.5668  ORF Transcript_5211/g.5668 Transcript_5211/m.5668 type:complete len:161 (+) Transcript_5211:69-551(+)